MMVTGGGRRGVCGSEESYQVTSLTVTVHFHVATDRKDIRQDSTRCIKFPSIYTLGLLQD